MAFSDRLWRQLIDDIEDRLVVPVIGPELLVVNAGGEDALLSDYLARELAANLELSQPLPPARSLNELVSEFLRRPGSDPEDLYRGVRQILRHHCCLTPEPLKKLAAISHFDVYISTTFDCLLEQALNEQRFGGAARTRSLAYSRKRNPDDLPAEYLERSHDGADPLVYYLFGKLGPRDDYALMEDDILHFCHRLQSRDHQPSNLFDLLQNKNILALGCGFPGWLTRFFLAAAKGDKYITDGARGVVADHASAQDPGLVLFLERRKTAVYEAGDAVAFVDSLHRQWMERFGTPSPAASREAAPADLPEFKPDSVFLSYASEDRAAAQIIRDALEQAGVNVWFDQRRLESGDVFEEKILRNIERCSVFIPVISRHVTISGRRFFFEEWDKAARESRRWPDDDPYIQPIVIDDTPVDAEHIRREFRERHWQRMEDGRLPDDFVVRVKQRVRQLRRERDLA